MEETLIVESLDRFGRQHRRRRMVRAIARGAWGGAAGALVMVLLAKVVNLPLPEQWLGLLPLLFAPAGAAVVAWLRRVPLGQIAREVDSEANLEERVTTALEWIEKGHRPSLMSRAQLRDAEHALKALDPRQAFPARWPRMRAVPVMLAAALVLLLIPPWHLFPEDLSAAERETLQKQAALLDQRAEELKNRALANPKLEPKLTRIAQDLKSLSRDLQSPGISRREALSRIAAQRQEVQQAQKALQSQNTPQPSKSAQAGTGQRETPGKTDPGQSDAAKMQSAARKLKENKPLSKTEQQALQRALQKAMQDPQASEALKKALQQAAKSLQAGNPSEAAKALEQAASQMQPDNQVAAQTLDQVMSELASAQEGLTGQPMPGQGPPGSSKEVELASAGVPSQGKQGKYDKGKGDKPGDYGKGSTNKEEKSEQPGPSDYVLERQANNQTSAMSRAWERLNVPERHQLPTGNAKISGGRRLPGAVLATGQEVRGAPKAGDRSLVPESDTYMQYRREAEEAMLREKIPAEHRDLIRGYFEEIDPRGN